MITDGSTSLPPVLRWAGGKRWIVPLVADLIGDTEVQNYHEPFLGGAAVFFGLGLNGKAYLSDLNAELIETYTTIRDHPDQVWRFLKKYRNTKEDYYSARSSAPRKAGSRAARFIYLNHTSFNGIYRVNLAGAYNVPYGYRKWYNVPCYDDLLASSSRLRTAVLTSCDFAEAVEKVGPGDLVFLDPPYTVSHNNNGFVKYNNRLFSFSDQQRLSKAIDRIKELYGYYVLTNAAHESIAKLFGKGDRLIETQRKNAVGGRTAARGMATEFLFTNLPKP